MVLLESIFIGHGGRCVGYTEKGPLVRIEGVAHPNAIAVHGERNIDKELNQLRETARLDSGKYYLIQDASEIMQGRSNMPDSFAIAYTTYEI